MLELISGDDPLLHRRLKDVDLERSELTELIQDMLGVMITEGGVGLAANQIGVDQRVAVVLESLHDNVTVLLDPEIIKKSGSTKIRNEGCLSYPNEILPVPRSTKITVRYRDMGGAVVETTFKDYAARIVQHEIDHLNGITFKDRNRDYEKTRL
jgi:peptide deformylase